jgi:hypothetical protein
LDLKVMQSERMTDFEDGGGRMSANPVVDGVVGNVFPDISTLNTITGNVSLRKVFLSVDTANTDPYLGVFGFLSDPPIDDLVSVVAFNTASATDLRAAARSYVENYRIQAQKTQLVLYGNHLQGQSTVQVYTRRETPSPDIGDVLCLSVEGAGYTPGVQFVAVQEVLSRTTVTFWDQNTGADFQRDVLIIKITTALSRAFPGREDPIQGAAAAPTIVRATQVSDAARYYGVLPLIQSADQGDLKVRVATPYAQIVPTATAETPVVDQLAGLGSVAMIQSGDTGSLSFSGSLSGAANVPAARHFGSPYARRSLFISVGATELRDDGEGGIVAVDPSSTGWSGEADYQTGRFAIQRDVGFSGSVSATATPAGPLLEQNYSYSIPITPANRNTTYIFQLDANMAPGSVVLDYLALGEWIRLRDNGAGQLVGGTNHGSATVNYATGTVSVTLGALPDVDTDIIVAWGTDLRARNSSGEIDTPIVQHVQQLDRTDIEPGTLTMAWDSGGTPRTATSNAAGALSGDATGTVDAVNGVVRFATAHAPDAQITYAYDYATGVHSEDFNPAKVGSQVNVTLANGPVRPGSVRCRWLATHAYAYGNVAMAETSRVVDVFDDGVGTFYLPAVSDNYGADGFEGTVNYSTGAIAMDVDALLPTWIVGSYEFRRMSNGALCTSIASWALENSGYSFESGQLFSVRYQEAGGGTVSTSENHNLPAVNLYLGRGAAGPAVPGSVRFTFRGRTYVDRGGSLYYDIDPATNTGTLGGSYDYAGNIATVTDIGSGSSTTVTIHSLLTRYTNPGVSAVLFRAPGRPLRPGNFTVRATTLAGDIITASADINGELDAANIIGQVDWQTGICRVFFGEWVTAAGNESEPWFDPENVVGSDIFKPVLVDPSSVFFGVVIYSSIPVDPEIIGIDPVRLPSDGRVVAIRPGDVAVVHHTVETSQPSPVGGTVVNLGRERLAWAQVFDADGTPVESVWYTLDLDAGELTWANPLNLSAYTLPITIRHRIEDARLCTDVQISGDITLQAPLTHDFPADAQISAAIAYGDKQARQTNLFDQGTWTSVWSDTQIGAGATGSYNNTVYPIAVTNDGAIDERWALVFVNPNAVNVIGETVGQVLTNAPIDSDIAPINPVSGKPYFTLAAAGFGGGWASQNVIRFNTLSATVPTWLARVIKPGTPSVDSDRTRLQYYGNAH